MTLQEYIVEAGSAVMTPLTSFKGEGESAFVWFNKNGLVKDGKIYCGKSKDIYFTLDEIEELYKYAEENNKSCPIIANYQGRTGKFVFRRWVGADDESVNIFDNIDIRDQKGSPYMGLHNTNMKDEGHWFPSPEDYEYIIAYAYNKVNNFFTNDAENMLYVSGKPIAAGAKTEQLMLHYSNNKNEIDNIVSQMPSNLGRIKKLPTEKTSSLKEWEEAGHYLSRINKTPKTDLITEKGYKISLKKAGGSQLMSGFECESRATLSLCARKLGNSEIIDEVESLFKEEWARKLTKHDKDKREAARLKNSDLTTIIRNLFKNKDFKRAVMYEAASGEMKFGKNSDSCANYVFVWNEVKKSDNKFYTIDEYIDHIFDSATPTIAFKTADKTSTSLRIITK